MATNGRELRHQQILELLRTRGRVGVAEFGEHLGVTEMTVRRDLEILEADGVLKRYHGGAELVAGSSYEPPFAARERTNPEAKQAVAEVVSRLIADGDTVLLDGGSSGLAVAQALANRPVTVCPLSLRAAWQLAKSSSVRLLIPGGAIRQGERTFVGAETVAYLQDHHFDHYVLTASGLSIRGGVSEWNPEDAAVKRAALGVAEQVIAAVDASKYGRVGFVRVCPISVPDVVVTDDSLGDGPLKELREHVNRLEIAMVPPSA